MASLRNEGQDIAATDATNAAPSSSSAQLPPINEYSSPIANIPSQASEAPTLVLSEPREEDNEAMLGEDDAAVIASSEHLQQLETQDDNNNNISIDSLTERAPKVTHVLEELRQLHQVRELFSHSQFFQKKEDQGIFFDTEELWGSVSDKLLSSIVKYTPRNQKDITKKSAKYENKKRKILQKFISKHELFEKGEDEDKWWEMRHILPCIGIEFMKIFQKLITPLGGKERVSIPQQIEKLVAEAVIKDVKDLFDKIVAQHVYYIVGFFCRAGEQEAKRRTKNNDVGRCIKAIDKHFAAEDENEDAVKAIVSQLPEGLEALVRSRSVYGKLKYPDIHLYQVFAVIELVYSKIATPINFTMFGGLLLPQILQGVLHNKTIVDLFTNLFDPIDNFSPEIIQSTLSYYLKVFGNVRVKDLCRRYNSNLLKSATSNLRSSLAPGVTGGGGDGEGKDGGTTKKKKRKRKASSKQPSDSTKKTKEGYSSFTVAQLKDKLRERSLPVSGRKQELVDRLEADDKANKSEAENSDECLDKEVEASGGTSDSQDSGPGKAMKSTEEEKEIEEAKVEEEEEDDDDDDYHSSDDEESVYQEEDMDVEEVHKELLQVAEERLDDDDEEYRKICSIDPEREEYMGRVDGCEEDSEEKNKEDS